MLLLARRLCDVLGLVSPFRGGTRSRAVVTLCTVRVKGATAPALLGGAEEPLLDGHLACDLPGLAVGDALAVACAVRGCGGDGPARPHPRRAAPVRGDVFYGEGPFGLRRLPCFGREEGCCDAYMRGAWSASLSRALVGSLYIKIIIPTLVRYSRRPPLRLTENLVQLGLDVT